MRLQLLRYRCGTCGKWFEAPEISELGYGEFLLRSIGGEMRYLDANLDRVFTEVDKLIGMDGRVHLLNQFQRADILHDVFGVACDPDLHGYELRITEKAPCSHCNQRKVAEFESVEPVTYVDMDVPPVTHDQWNRLSDSEKRTLVRQALDASPLV